MWHHSLVTPQDVRDSFSDWLADAPPRDGEPPCLLDIVAMWVGHEDNAADLPPYDMFMAGLVLIIEAWLTLDRNSTYDGAPYWTRPDNEPVDVPRLLDLTSIDDNDPGIVEIGVAHELFNPAAYEATRSAATARRLLRITEMLERVTPNEPKR